MPPTIATGFPVPPATKLELQAIKHPHAQVKRKQREIDGMLKDMSGIISGRHCDFSGGLKKDWCGHREVCDGPWLFVAGLYLDIKEVKSAVFHVPFTEAARVSVGKELVILDGNPDLARYAVEETMAARVWRKDAIFSWNGSAIYFQPTWKAWENFVDSHGGNVRT
ncbi:hypothetical protein E4U48_006570 [Claviceps purpurea]|nr:hypothetical protein E4U27_004373 [Claviceps purpurea]KAG6192299.1 hypothetical protein E4U10_004290 [Claviceps purpurea]KAG6241387.1 hypothetical protein E4U25_006335 [Claviceps purpurea]KAG6247714.1 hypothetical protein E4U23_003583 [Claviceps purpurea]KAG6263678.1 hypothetical protein E4U48_006570 [Claviceps purpurea]